MMGVARKLSLLAVTATCLVGAAPPQQQSSSESADTIAMGRDGSQRMTVPVWIGDRGPYPFLVDTGAERTMISGELASSIGLKPGASVEIATISGLARVGSFAVDDFTFHKQRTDIQAPALARQNIGAAGLIGLDSLGKMRVEFDFAGNRLRVLPTRNRFLLDRAEVAVDAIERQGRLIFTDATVEGRSIPVVIDTGAEVSIGNRALFAQMMRSKPHRAHNALTILSVSGGRVPAEISYAHRMTVGNFDFHGVPIAFADAHAFRELGLADRPALLLGMNVLRHFDRVTIDFGARQVRFIPEGYGMRRSQTRMAQAAARAPRS